MCNKYLCGVKYRMKQPKLLAPVGDWAMLSTAVNSGADAVYFGVSELNMRAKAKNFEVGDLGEIVEICQKKGIETNLTINSIIMEEEVPRLEEVVIGAKESGIDIIICWDTSVIQLCREYEIPFCVSTQASVSNSRSANFYKSLGAKRVVLARECSLEEIRKIRSETDIEIEAFVHGAMCVAISGRCFMSHSLFGKSANQGECIQPCRREYEIIDKQDNNTLILGEDYILSPKDLCTIKFIDQLIESGINIFKIEGRKRSPDYLSKVLKVYRQAIDLYFEKGLTDSIKEDLYNQLGKVYNRGFSSGFYFGLPDQNDYTERHGNVSTTRKKYAGRILNYFKKTKVAHIKLEAADLRLGDEIYIIGNRTGVLENSIKSMVINEQNVSEALRGDEITILCDDLVRRNDKVYKVETE